ncbi:UNVERIFIED_CONTAM: hypothetical protein Sradi_5820900 [Sesamum radiatum]|uniref:DUF4283 domain-containing protein n=1 Tax=Sesamum radiatum TaxID=300843 RepID=A0AAW2KSS6_SESRA
MQNSVPSLSHNTHTLNPTAHICQTTDGIDEGDNEAEANSGGELHRSEKSLDKDSIEITRRIHKEFDFNEFYDLAMKVLNGDSASLERLNSLQDRWQEKIQPTVEESSAAKPLQRNTVLGVPTPTVAPLPLDEGRATPNLTEEGETGDQVSPLTCPNPPPSTSIDCAQEIFIGNIKLQPNPIDTIASAFLQSSRKTLQFVPPSIEKGEVIIRPSPAIIAQGSQRWQSTSVGYFLGRKPYFPHLESYVRSNWRDLQQISGTSSGFYFFRFKTRAAMEEIIEEGPWLFQGQPIVLQCWEQGCSLGHTAQTCPDNKVGEHIQPVQVFVKNNLLRWLGKGSIQADMQRAEADPEPSVLTAANKQLDAPFYGQQRISLHGQSATKVAAWNVRGLNGSDHQLAVDTLVREHHIQFLGLIETRVSIVNVSRIRKNLLHSWSWFDDYVGPAGRIWLTWNNLEIEVEILWVESQIIHCRTTNKRSHTKCLISVLYGDCELISRRTLWATLQSLAGNISDEPWLVLGDFNAVLDDSEVWGRAADTIASMNEFGQCIMATGLIHLPFTGCPYTWHNCSEGSRSLWKRLDRMLVNATWLERWPHSSYLSALPSTSDHPAHYPRG